MKKHSQPQDSSSTVRKHNEVRKSVNAPSKKHPSKKPKKKKKFHIYVAVLFVWLIAITVGFFYIYDKLYEFQVRYEAAYQASQPGLVMDEAFTHFEQYDIDYIWANMSEHPGVSEFESEDDVKTYMRSMIEGKTLTYLESGEYTSENPTYAIEADGYVIGSVVLKRDLTVQKEFGFPTWIVSDISFPALPLEGAMITLPSNSSVYINGIMLDDTYITSEITVDEDDLQYVDAYGGDIPGFTTYAITGLYYEPEVVVKDFDDQESPVEYDSERDQYSAGYSELHPEKDVLEEFGINFTTTFANVISRDESLSDLDPFFPPDSIAYDYISRNTALRYFTSHSSVSIENTEVREFIAYNEDTVYMEVYIEQWMQIGWGDSEPEVVPTDAHIYCVKIDGEWQISGIRY